MSRRGRTDRRSRQDPRVARARTSNADARSGPSAPSGPLSAWRAHQAASACCSTLRAQLAARTNSMLGGGTRPVRAIRPRAAAARVTRAVDAACVRPSVRAHAAAAGDLLGVRAHACVVAGGRPGAARGHRRGDRRRAGAGRGGLGASPDRGAAGPSAATVRGWLRRLCGRAEAVRSGFTALLIGSTRWRCSRPRPGPGWVTRSRWSSPRRWPLWAGGARW